MNGLRVLIVEDQAIIALWLKSSLELHGCEVCGITGRGEEAMELAESLMPDIVVMDIFLSGAMNGIEAARVIAGRLGIPIVYMTGNSDDAMLAEAMETAPLGYLKKPIMGDELISIMRGMRGGSA
jgi:DNA-binding NarL/FixJ family response regulator